MTGKEARDETRTSDLLFLAIDRTWPVCPLDRSDRFPFHDRLGSNKDASVIVCEFRSIWSAKSIHVLVLTQVDPSKIFVKRKVNNLRNESLLASFARFAGVRIPGPNFDPLLGRWVMYLFFVWTISCLHKPSRGPSWIWPFFSRCMTEPSKHLGYRKRPG